MHIETIEDGLWREFQEFLRKVESFQNDDWFELSVRTRLNSFSQSLMVAWCAFEQSRPDRATRDGGPTPADIAGEVQHDIG